ncbi:MAG: hypothetical protein EB075_05980 [Bacteroidetes bacterium]|nr:hypothetical protein [Bacteroidota bacterium]
MRQRGHPGASCRSTIALGHNQVLNTWVRTRRE